MREDLDVLLKMKLIYVIIATYFLVLSSHAEKVDVYSCESKARCIEWSESEEGDIEFFITLHRVGEKLGVLDLGPSTIKEFVDGALAYDSSDDPFCGPGINYLIKDSQGNFYIAFFEYIKGSDIFDGSRMAVNRTTLIDIEQKVYFGSPYAGYSFDKSILKQLKEITVKQQAEQGVVPNP